MSNHTIIPAEPGWSLVIFNSNTAYHDRSPILAWEITVYEFGSASDPLQYIVTPITLGGKPDPKWIWAVATPDRKYFVNDHEFTSSTDLREHFLAQAKQAAE